ncbi:MAG: hypothetical protein ACI96N_003057, partial [Arenicella sp.]
SKLSLNRTIGFLFGYSFSAIDCRWFVLERGQVHGYTQA